MKLEEHDEISDIQRLKTIGLSFLILAFSLALGQFSTLVSIVAAKVTLAVLSATGIGIFMCLAMNVPLRKIGAVIGTSLTVIALVIVYAQ